MASRNSREIPLLLALCLSLLLVSSEGRNLQSKVSHVSKLVRTTNPKDVQGLEAIVLQFAFIYLNLGPDNDPCLPNPWTWIECSTATSPRVTALYLGNQNLQGPIPDFSTMDALETIDMHHNGLTGEIPSFLGTLPNLKELNLANNWLSGYVPASIQQNKKLKKDLSGNPALFQLPPTQAVVNSPDPDSFGGSTTETPFTYAYQKPKGKKKSNLPAIIGGSAAGFIILFCAGGGAFAVARHKAKTAAAVAQATTTTTAGTNKPTETTEETPMNAATTPSH